MLTSAALLAIVVAATVARADPADIVAIGPLTAVAVGGIQAALVWLTYLSLRARAPRHLDAGRGVVRAPDAL